VSLWSEIEEELRYLVTGPVGIADGIVPPLIFVVANSIWGLTPALAAGVGSAIVIVGWRLARRRPVRFAVAGLGGTLFAAALTLRSGEASDYFLPGIITGAGTTILIVISIVARRPFVAWVSSLTRGWPLAWYWHPKVRPAYTKVSWLWAVFFATRTMTQFWLYTRDQTAALGLIRVMTGWPALLLLLIATYVLGRRWLTALRGPSVTEYETGASPPWASQAHGF
jgi:Protein of unknown function (DUF3159)